MQSNGAPVNRIISEKWSGYSLSKNVALNTMSNGSGSAFWTTTTPTWTAWDTNAWNITDGALPTLKMNSASTNSPGSLTLTASHDEGKPGEEVEITVSLVNNHGIAGFDLALVYNSAILTPLSVTKNPALDDAIFASNVNEIADKSTLGGVITAVWAANHDIDVDELFTIRFWINGAVTGDDNIVTPVDVYIQDMKYLTRQDVSANRHNGSVTVLLGCSGSNGCDCNDCKNKDLWGDVNVDGVVDIYDLIRFAKHLAAIPSEELSPRGYYLADVDRNSNVDLGDLILLTRYLQSADMDNPDVILGIPQ